MSTIQIVFRPILSGSPEYVPGLTGAYHEFLLYTDNNSNRFYASGGPANGRLTTQLGAFVPASSEFPSTTDANGSLVLNTAVFNSYYRYTIDFGSDLSQQWQSITTAITTIGAQGATYQFMSQNSNSAASEALRQAGYEPPNASFFGVPWGGDFS